MTPAAIRAVVLIGSILVGMPVGSFYSWSVFINPLRLARPNFTATASVHANSIVIAALAVACAITGKLLRCARTCGLLERRRSPTRSSLASACLFMQLWLEAGLCVPL
jgi:hypothetical protein